jgi:secreted trypsin-like serine protease
MVSAHGQGACEEQEYALYTKVPSYVKWIKDKMNGRS